MKLATNTIVGITWLLALQLASSARLNVDVDDTGLEAAQNQNDCDWRGEAKGECGRVGIEVEFNDGLIHRESTPGCDFLLDYGQEWFKTDATYDVSKSWGAGARVPKFNVESEVRNRDTIEVSTGPARGTGEIMHGLERVGHLAKILKGLKGKSMTMGELAQEFHKQTKNKTVLSESAQSCGDDVTISGQGGSNILAGVQVNVETKIHNILEFGKPGVNQEIMQVLGTGGKEHWDAAWACYNSLADGVSNDHKGKYGFTKAIRSAYLISILFMVKTKSCENKHSLAISCKIGLDILPKANIQDLSALTNKDFAALSEIMTTTQECRNHVPSNGPVPGSHKHWNPDEVIFSKRPLGLGTNPSDSYDPYIIIELRGASGTINSAIKTSLTSLENNRQMDQGLQKKIACLQRWAMRGWPFTSSQECDLPHMLR